MTSKKCKAGAVRKMRPDDSSLLNEKVHQSSDQRDSGTIVIGIAKTRNDGCFHGFESPSLSPWTKEDKN